MRIFYLLNVCKEKKHYLPVGVLRPLFQAPTLFGLAFSIACGYWSTSWAQLSQPSPARSDVSEPTPSHAIGCGSTPLIRWQEPNLEHHPRAEIVRVGPGRPIDTPADAAKTAADGSIVLLDNAHYPGGIARWPQNDLTILGTDGQPHITADGRSVQGRDVWLFTGNNVRVENVRISGARSVRHNHGSAIRHTGHNITLRNVSLRDNETGLMTANGAKESTTIIEYSELGRSGVGKGINHNIYIGQSKRFELRFSHSYDSSIGHLVKSRARENLIMFNRLEDSGKVNPSYLIDIPEGGIAIVMGNELIHGAQSDNSAMVAYATEAFHDDWSNSLLVANNTWLNRHPFATAVVNHSKIKVVVANNLFAGIPLTIARGSAVMNSNLTRHNHGMVNPESYDFRLLANAPAIDVGELIRHSDQGTSYEYHHPQAGIPRPKLGPIDVGAHEWCGEASGDDLR